LAWHLWTGHSVSVDATKPLAELALTVAKVAAISEPMSTPKPMILESEYRQGEPCQESDLLERGPQGLNCCDDATNGVMLVSLGCYCGPKLSFKKMGRGAETLPFDWMRTRIEGLLYFLRSDFDGFFDFVTKEPVPGSSKMIMYRNYLHSFWHDDPTDPSMHEKYNRRIARFNSIDARSQHVLFVRVAAATDELLLATELLSELTKRFGERARLLLILNFQTKTSGPAFLENCRNLILYFLTPDAHKADNPNFCQPYAEPVRVALEWAVGRGQEKAVTFSSAEIALEAAEGDNWGFNGLGGLRAFEEGDAAAA